MKHKVKADNFKGTKYEHYIKDEMTNQDIQMLGYQIFKDKLEAFKEKIRGVFHGKNRQKNDSNN